MGDNRPPTNMQSLLRLAIENSSDGRVDPTLASQLDPERREFLENAFKNMTVDVVQELRKAIKILESPDSTNDEKCEAMSNVRDYCYNMDFANNFVQIGGSKVLLDCLKSSNVPLCLVATSTLAELCQNNLFCQKHFLDTNALELLMDNYKNMKGLSSSSLNAISCLLRHCEETTAKFIKLQGIEFLMEVLENRNGPEFMKCCFLIRALAADHVPIKEKLLKLGAVAKIVCLLDPVVGYESKTEFILSALCTLTDTNEGKQCLRNTDCCEVLRSIIENNNEKPECEEIVRDSALLLDRFLDDSSLIL